MAEMAEAQFEVIQRRCGGWLAYSSRKRGLRIGVTGRSKAEAVERYQASFSEWKRNIEAGHESGSRG